jgi:tetratricopeptide (TPR) repeat protein
MGKTDRKRRKPAQPGAGQKPPEKTPANLDSRRKVMGICVALAALTLAVFGQTLRHEFVNYDDDKYVYENPVVEKGLTLKGVAWALTYGEIGHWHPLTWLTHMADCQVYGLWAGGHHLTNVLLHTASVILLFLVLRLMTGALWRSAFVAAAFAIHPLHVESVAWVSERKDVLSGLFFMLTLWAYVHHTRQPSRRRYVGVVVLYGLGLLSKNTLVTLPFVLLLLDWWPLNRMKSVAGVESAGSKSPGTPFWGLVKEKIPLFLLSVGSCLVTIMVPEKLPFSHRLPVWLRVENALTSYVTYLHQMVIPTGLANPYPYPPNGASLWQAALAFVLLAAISWGALLCRKKSPFFLMGWLWYLGMMVPMIGIVQIAFYAHADRYAYLSEIGLYVALAWTMCSLVRQRMILGFLAVLVVAVLSAGAYVQTGYWRDSETLWKHTLACTGDNPLAYNNLGTVLLDQGHVEEAIVQYQKAVEIEPGGAMFHDYLGNALLQEGHVDEAIIQLQKAVEIEPDKAVHHENLGNALLQKGQVDEAIAHFQKALELKPDKEVVHNNAVFHNNLGNALIQKGAVDEAIVHYQKAVEIEPANAVFHYNLANALIRKGRLDEAIQHYQRTVEIEPNSADAQNNLGNVLLQKKRVDEAIIHFQKAIEIEPDNALFHTNLNNALLQKTIRSDD